MPLLKLSLLKHGLLCMVMLTCLNTLAQQSRQTIDFDKGWRFNLGAVTDGQLPGLNDAGWRSLNLPHDWSIEGKFSKDNPATPEGGALPGGIGWYRKTFTVPAASKTSWFILILMAFIKKAMFGSMGITSVSGPMVISHSGMNLRLT